MADKKYIMGLFKNEDQVVETLAALKESAYQFQRVHSPIPSHKIMANSSADSPWPSIVLSSGN
jgi:hypothetical protein